jgi:hypothetical protein
MNKYVLHLPHVEPEQRYTNAIYSQYQYISQHKAIV